MLQIKRIYDVPAKSDGTRVLVDRLWPRGIAKESAALELWLKEIAPSSDLRIWFNHEADKFEEFGLRYIDELNNNPAVTQLDQLIDRNPIVTLLYAAKNSKINHAVVLRDFMLKRTSRVI